MASHFRSATTVKSNNESILQQEPRAADIISVQSHLDPHVAAVKTCSYDGSVTAIQFWYQQEQPQMNSLLALIWSQLLPFLKFMAC